MDHVRIDEGIKRGSHVQYLPRNERDEQTGQFKPLLPPEQRLQAIANAAQRIALGEPLKDIAADIGITLQALSLWLLDECPAEYEVAKRRGLIQRIVNADHDLATACNPLEVARAREQCRFARWDAERRLPKLFGQQTHITVEHVGDLAERLRRARERVIEGEATPVTE